MGYTSKRDRLLIGERKVLKRLSEEKRTYIKKFFKNVDCVLDLSSGSFDKLIAAENCIKETQGKHQ